jgi:hypothetical protein
MNEHEQLTQLCLKLGADRVQAERMASQLVKRTDQLVAERGISRMDAMGYLLQLVTKGRNGETPAGFEGQPSLFDKK